MFYFLQNTQCDAELHVLFISISYELYPGPAEVNPHSCV